VNFSERQGIKPIRKVLQTATIDDGLRNRLWNVLTSQILTASPGYLSEEYNPELLSFCQEVWDGYLKISIDTIPKWPDPAIAVIRKHFFGGQWYEVYNFLEFAAEHSGLHRRSLEKEFNKVLENELSAYRFVAGLIVPISSEQENRTIEAAIAQTSNEHRNVSEHLRRALDLLAKKPDPDYRNSIKESISAVEALCAVVTGKAKTTLSDALKVIDNYAPVHGAFRAALEKLYGYTGDAEGIRHALMEEASLKQEDAVFMLAACSAFVSYVLAKSARKPAARAESQG
jgi:hypothetical protein